MSHKIQMHLDRYGHIHIARLVPGRSSLGRSRHRDLAGRLGHSIGRNMRIERLARGRAGLAVWD